MHAGGNSSGSPVLTELRLVYAVRMPSGKLRRYLRPSFAYRLAAKLELGEGASDMDVAALARRLRFGDTNPRKRTRLLGDQAGLEVKDDTTPATTSGDSGCQ